MSSSNKVYNIGNFNIRVSYLGIDEIEQEMHKKNIDSFLDCGDGPDKSNPYIDFRIVKDSRIVNMIRNEIQMSGEAKETKGYFNSEFLNYETEDAVYNYCDTDKVCIVRDKKDGSVSYYYDENSRQPLDISMYLLREIIIKKNKDVGNYILHSASFEKHGKGFVMVGQAGAGKTSLLLGFLKSGDGVKYISNDINFVDKTGTIMYPFQIPMLLSDDTAESYFGKDANLHEKLDIIEYDHKELGKRVTKFKLPNSVVEEMFNVKSSNSANIQAIIIPNFNRKNSGINFETLDKEEAYSIILDQVLENDKRFKVDYLKLVSNENPYDREAFARMLVERYPIIRVDYGVDIYKQENIERLREMLNELAKEQGHEYGNAEILREGEVPVVKKPKEIGDDKKGKRDKSQGKFELHCHTTASDGIMSPTQLIDFAEASGVDTIAITDHNSVNGSLEAQKYIKETGKNISIINGVEIDANDFSMFHLLAYGVKDMQKMKKYLDNLEEQNQEVFKKIINNLTKVGVDISLEKVRELAGQEKIAKIHIINYLKRNGYAKDGTEVQEKYLGRHCESYVERVQPSVKEVINLIHECGGICVFAHPMELSKMNPKILPDMKSIKELIEKLKEMGLDGVECYSPKHTPEQAKELYDYCEKLGLVQTYGNDYHARDGQLFGTDKHEFREKLISALAQSPGEMGE